MINLLPPQFKKELLREERYKLILILEILILFFLTTLFLSFFLIKIFLFQKTELQKIETSLEEKKFVISQIQEFEKEISSINRDLSKLNSFYQNQIFWTLYLEKISQLLPSDLYLTNLSINSLAKEKNQLQVGLAGFSPNREKLLEFKQKLEATPDFKKIYFPPLNWVKPNDIDFSLTFQIISQ